MAKLINQNDRFFVAGHRGMAGSAICRALQRSGYESLLTASRDELDLLDLQAVQSWFAENKPTVVVLAAAKVGGIYANNTSELCMSKHETPDEALPELSTSCSLYPIRA